MCFHSYAEFEAWTENQKRAAERDKVAGKHGKSERKYAAVVLRCKEGKWVAGWHCDPTDAQDVANTIADLKSWHPGEFKYVDTSDVDKERAKLKLPVLDADGLPLPNRLPRESVDKLVEAFDIENKSALPPGGLGQINRSVKARREEEALRKEAARIAALSPEERANEEEMVKLSQFNKAFAEVFGER